MSKIPTPEEFLKNKREKDLKQIEIAALNQPQLKQHLNFLDKEDRFDLNLIGGKATGLVKMKSLNLPVPNFFILSSTYFDLIRKQVGKDFTRRILEQSDLIKVQLENEYIHAMAYYLYHSLQHVGFNNVIIRSSANFEDNKEHLFAGMFNSIPTKVDLVSIKKALQKVVESVFSSKLIHYCQSINLDFNELKIAFVIQEYIPDIEPKTILKYNDFVKIESYNNRSISEETLSLQELKIKNYILGEYINTLINDGFKNFAVEFIEKEKDIFLLQVREFNFVEKVDEEDVNLSEFDLFLSGPTYSINFGSTQGFIQNEIGLFNLDKLTEKDLRAEYKGYILYSKYVPFHLSLIIKELFKNMPVAFVLTDNVNNFSKNFSEKDFVFINVKGTTEIYKKKGA